VVWPGSVIRLVDTLIELIQFAGVAVAFVGVVVAVVRATAATLAGDRRGRVTEISLELARTVLVGLDLLLVAAILEAAVAAGRPAFTRLAVVAGLRIGLTLLLTIEVAYRSDTGPDRGVEHRRPALPPWEEAARRRLRPAPPPGPNGNVENVWGDRVHLGRD
jgi:uncharacterized membrane protein